jgi:hypothetical protein
MINLTKKEFFSILIAVIISWFVIGFSEKLTFDFLIIIIPLIIIPINIFSKKIAGEHFGIAVEHKLWEFSRYGWYERSKLKKEFPIGAFLPFILSFLSLGLIKCFLILQFDSKNIPQKRILKKSGRIRKTEMNESDIAFTSAAGFYSLLLLFLFSVIIYFILKSNLSFDLNIFLKIAKYSIYYGIWNLLPISQLDGSRLFYGSRFIYFMTLVIYIIALIFALTI